MTAHPAPPAYDPLDPIFVAHESGKLRVEATKPLRDRADLALLATDAIIFALADPTGRCPPRGLRGMPRSSRAAGRLPEPDQQRAGPPRDLPRRPGRWAKEVTEELKLAAAGIAGLVATPTPEEIVPSVFAPGVADVVAREVAALV